MTKDECYICGVVMDQNGSVETLNCGGYCLECMANRGDPWALKVMKLIDGEQNND